jgi:hypothetical protein
MILPPGAASVGTFTTIAVLTYQAIMILPPGAAQVPIAVTFAREADKEEK